MIRAYNEWLIEEYCSLRAGSFDRYGGSYPTTTWRTPSRNSSFALKPVSKGCASINFPAAKAIRLPEDDQFWTAAMELGMPVTAHTNGGTTRFMREGPGLPIQ